MNIGIVLAFLTVGPLVLVLLLRELFSERGLPMSEKNARTRRTLMEVYLLCPLPTAALAVKVGNMGIFVVNLILLFVGAYIVGSERQVRQKK